MSARRRWILPVTLGVLVLAALVFAIVATRESGGGSRRATAAAPSATAPLRRAAASTGRRCRRAAQAPPITLTDQYGARASRWPRLRGQPVVLAFLYSRCGAPCTLIAQQIRGALDELRAAGPGR